MCLVIFVELHLKSWIWNYLLLWGRKKSNSFYTWYPSLVLPRCWKRLDLSAVNLTQSTCACMKGRQEWEWKERKLSEEAGSWGDTTLLFLEWVAPWPQLEGAPGCSTRKMSLLDFIMYETANQTYLLIYSRSFPLTLTPAVSVLPHFTGKLYFFTPLHLFSVYFSNQVLHTRHVKRL